MGEVEFYGVVRGSGIGMGVRALYADLELTVPLRVWTDSSAAIGIVGRQGLGKLRHIECSALWIQQRVRRREFELRKVLGTENPADLFTKYLDSRGKVDHVVRCLAASTGPAGRLQRLSSRGDHLLEKVMHT